MPPLSFTKPMMPAQIRLITVMSYMFMMPPLPVGPLPITDAMAAGSIVPSATPTIMESTVPPTSTANTFTPISAATRTAT